jgi:hypothetical protein
VSRLEIFSRAVLNAGIVAAIASGLSAWIAAPLFLVGVAATGELAMRPYARNGVDRVLFICGATVTALILIGLCLNLTPWGLTRGTWAFSWLVVSSAVLVWRRASATFIPVDRIRLYCARHWLVGLYGLAAIAIFIVAGVIAMSGVRIWNQKPMLAFSLVSKNSSTVVVKIDAISTNGTYRIVASSGSPHAQRYSSPPISVSAGAKGQALNESVPVNVSGRWTIYLNAVNGSTGLRELIVDVG